MKRNATDNDDEGRVVQKARLAEIIGEKEKDSDGSTSSEDKKPKAVADATTAVTETRDTTETTAKLPSRKPKNFAERLMRVLQEGVGPDTIWWVGDGKAIAVHIRNLKKGDMLAEHFKVKDYSVFIRNCNRWGFRRTVQYNVPQGVITYQCSLFQKDEPHLVHHMRMDSDVQDVFVKHRDQEGNAPFDPKRIAKAARAAASAAGHDPRFPPPRAAAVAPLPQSSPGVVQGLTKEDILQLIQGAGSATRDPPGAAIRPAATTTPPVAPAKSSLEMALLQQLISCAAPPPPPPQLPQEQLLQRILSLSDEYLNHPSSTSNAQQEPIRMALGILKLQGDKYKEEQKEQQRIANGDTLALIRSHLMASTNNNTSVPPPPPNTTSLTDVLNLARPPSNNVNTPVVPLTTFSATASQDLSSSHQESSSSAALMQLLANNGIPPADPPPPQPQAPPPADTNALSRFLELLQQTDSNRK